ncbi:17787_t:CDS:10, partial [Cetraspora pellucida]
SEYFDKTLYSQWSYYGYLKAMEPYFDINVPVKTLKATWRKCFLNYLKDLVFNDSTNEEQKKSALYLTTKQTSCMDPVPNAGFVSWLTFALRREGAAPCLSDRTCFSMQHKITWEVQQFWEDFDLNRQLDAKQREVQVSTQINALKLLDAAVTHQTNEFIKRTRSNNINNDDDNSTGLNNVKLKKRKTKEDVHSYQFRDSYSSIDISSASSYTGSDFSLFENDEKIKFDFTVIAKQLEQEPPNEWVVEGIHVTRRFRDYQKKALNRASNEGLTWDDTYEVLSLSSILVLSWPCPYPMFTTEEWKLIMKTNPYVLTEPVFPPDISFSLYNAVCKHWNGEDVYIHAGNSMLSKAVARSFNDTYESIPPVAHTKMTEDEHCYKILHPVTRPFFLNSQKEYELQLSQGSKTRPDFACVSNGIAFLCSEIKPIGCTPLQKKKDSIKVQLKGQKAINQQLVSKGGPCEVALLTNFGDLVSSFIIDLKFDGLYRSWSFRTTRLVIDYTTIPLAEYSLSHFAALEAYVSKFVKDYKKRHFSTSPFEIRYMRQLPNFSRIEMILDL